LGSFYKYPKFPRAEKSQNSTFFRLTDGYRWENLTPGPQKIYFNTSVLML
jgi:hypothetical protein